MSLQKKLVLNIESTPHSTINVPRNLSLMYWIPFVRRRFKNSQLCKELKTSLALFPPRYFAVLESQFIREYSTKRAANVTNLLSFTSSFNVCCHFVSSVILSPRNVYKDISKDSPIWKSIFLMGVAHAQLKMERIVHLDQSMIKLGRVINREINLISPHLSKSWLHV